MYTLRKHFLFARNKKCFRTFSETFCFRKRMLLVLANRATLLSKDFTQYFRNNVFSFARALESIALIIRFVTSSNVVEKEGGFQVLKEWLEANRAPIKWNFSVKKKKTSLSNCVVTGHDSIYAHRSRFLHIFYPLKTTGRLCKALVFLYLTKGRFFFLFFHFFIIVKPGYGSSIFFSNLKKFIFVSDDECISNFWLPCTLSCGSQGTKDMAAMMAEFFSKVATICFCLAEYHWTNMLRWHLHAQRFWVNEISYAWF